MTLDVEELGTILNIIRVIITRVLSEIAEAFVIFISLNIVLLDISSPPDSQCCG